MALIPSEILEQEKVLRYKQLVDEHSITLIEEAIQKNGSITLGFEGHSMLPTMPTKAKVTIEKANLNDLKEGSILAFKNGKDIVAHRLIKMRKDRENIPTCFYTKGDNRFDIDNPVFPYQILGKVNAIFYEDFPDRNILNTNKILDKIWVLLGKLRLFINRCRIFVAPLLYDEIRSLVLWSYNKVFRLWSFLYNKIKRMAYER